MAAPLTLPEPAFYFPLRTGRYETSPNLTRLSEADFGNGSRDRYLFQFDDTFARYRANKQACRAEQFGKYICTDDFDPATRRAVTRLFLDRLTVEYPGLYTRTGTADCETLTCHLTGETLCFDPDTLELIDSISIWEYHDAWDALACQVMEDLVVVRRSEGRGDWNAALHLCAPSQWAAGKKVGLSFAATHAPVPGMDWLTRAAPALVQNLIHRPPTVRLGWSIEFDGRLNHHPDPPPGWSREAWCHPPFRPDADPPLVFRVERQTLWGLPAAEAFVFAIRVYHYDGRTIRADPFLRDNLVSALRTMPAASREYKSLAGSCDVVCEWLQAG